MEVEDLVTISDDDDNQPRRVNHAVARLKQSKTRLKQSKTRLKQSKTRLKQSKSTSSTRSSFTSSTSTSTATASECTSATDDCIAVDSESSQEDENDKYVKLSKKRKLKQKIDLAVAEIKKKNESLAIFAETCLNLENHKGMFIIITSKLMKTYNRADKTYIESKKFQRVVNKAINCVKSNPDKKFTYIKKLVDTLRKSEYYLTENNNTTILGKRKRKLKNNGRTKQRKTDSIVIDSEEDSDVIIEDVIDLDHVVIKKAQSSQKCPSVSSHYDDEKENIATGEVFVERFGNLAKSHENLAVNNEIVAEIDRNSAKNLAINDENSVDMLLTPNFDEVSLNPSLCKRPTEDLDSSKYSEERDDERPQFSEEVKIKIEIIEKQILLQKMIIKQLDEKEVDLDIDYSPYIQCEKAKETIVKLYQELRELAGTPSVKKKKVRLHAGQPHLSTRTVNHAVARLKQSKTRLKQSKSTSSTRSSFTSSTSTSTATASECTSATDDCIAVDSESSQEDENDKYVKLSKKRKLKQKIDLAVAEIKKQNKSMAIFAETCLNLKNDKKMLIIITRNLMKTYNQADKTYIESKDFQRVVNKAINCVKSNPNRKFYYIKKLVDTLSYMKSEHYLTENNNTTILGKHKRTLKNKGRTKQRKTDSIVIDSEEDSDVIIEDGIDLDHVVIKKSQSSQKCPSVSSHHDDEKENIATAESHENSDRNSAQNLAINDENSVDMLLTPDFEEVVPLNPSLCKRPTEDLDSSKYSEEHDDERPQFSEEVKIKIEIIEKQILLQKMIIKQLDEKEVDLDIDYSPYIQCEKAKETIVKLYQELRELTGTPSVKKKKVRLHAGQPHLSTRTVNHAVARLKQSKSTSSTRSSFTSSTSTSTATASECTSATDDCIAVDSESSQEDENDKYVKLSKKRKLKQKIDLAVAEIKKKNKSMAIFAETCLNLENDKEMLIIITRNLMKNYNRADKTYIESKDFQRVVNKAINCVKSNPNRKFYYIKKLVDTLSYMKSEHYLTENNNTTILGKRKRKLKNNGRIKQRKTDSMVIDSEEDSDVIIEDVIDLDHVVIKKAQSSQKCPSVSSHYDDEKENIATGESHENSDRNSAQNLAINDENSVDMLLTPDFEEVVPLNPSLCKRPTEDLDSSKYSEELDDERPQFSEEVKIKIESIEKQILLQKMIIKQLDEKEVDLDIDYSPYIQCEKAKETIVKLYQELRELTGTPSVKKKKVRLQVLEGHPPGPTKKLEEFINNNIGNNGLPQFPDFCDVVKCVLEASAEDGLGWKKSQVVKVASSLFTQCGSALQKRRMQREYRDLITLVKAEQLGSDDDDPANNDPELLRKLEENRRIASTKEKELLERYTMMQCHPAQPKPVPAPSLANHKSITAVNGTNETKNILDTEHGNTETNNNTSVNTTNISITANASPTLNTTNTSNESGINSDVNQSVVKIKKKRVNTTNISITANASPTLNTTNTANESGINSDVNQSVVKVKKERENTTNISITANASPTLNTTNTANESGINSDVNQSVVKIKKKRVNTTNISITANASPTLNTTNTANESGINSDVNQSVVKVKKERENTTNISITANASPTLNTTNTANESGINSDVNQSVVKIKKKRVNTTNISITANASPTLNTTNTANESGINSDVNQSVVKVKKERVNTTNISITANASPTLNTTNTANESGINGDVNQSVVKIKKKRVNTTNISITANASPTLNTTNTANESGINSDVNQSVVKVKKKRVNTTNISITANASPTLNATNTANESGINSDVNQSVVKIKKKRVNTTNISITANASPTLNTTNTANESGINSDVNQSVVKVKKERVNTTNISITANASPTLNTTNTANESGINSDGNQSVVKVKKERVNTTNISITANTSPTLNTTNTANESGINSDGNQSVVKVKKERVNTTNISITANTSPTLNTTNTSNESGINSDGNQSVVKVKKERVNIYDMLEALGDDFTSTVTEIEDPFLVIEILSDSEDEDNHTEDNNNY